MQEKTIGYMFSFILITVIVIRQYPNSINVQIKSGNSYGEWKRSSTKTQYCALGLNGMSMLVVFKLKLPKC